MKKLNKVLFVVLCFFFYSKITNAAGNVSVSASSNYVTTGSNVTFYIYVNNAAAWSLTGHGIGATSGCTLGDSGVGDSGTGNNVSKTIASVTCRTTSEGTVGFVVEGNISSASGSEIVKTNINTSKTVVVQKPREKDTNNYLKSLSIKDYKLTPNFNKDTLEYSVIVPSTVNKIVLEAEKESGYASLTGTGEFEVNEGVNSFEINVTSETGVGRVYKVTVQVEDENPIEIEIGNSKYTIMKNGKTLKKPATYESTTVKIKDFDIPAFTSEISKFTLIGAKDTKGTTHFLIYNQDSNTYELYNENKASDLVLYIEKIGNDTKDGFTKKNITIQSASYEALVSNVDESIILVKAMNTANGKIHFYQYDKEEGTFVIYNDSLRYFYEQEFQKYKDVILYFCIALGVSFFLILILLFKKPRKRKNKGKEENEVKIEKLEMEEKKESVVEQKSDKKSKKQLKKMRKEQQEVKQEINEKQINSKENDEKKSKKMKTKEDALKQVSDAASIIEEYEKTISLNKNDLKKKQIELEKQEETMYDIFEDEKKKKKK